ncbi:uncharacterized protein LOC113323369 isoform X3 [Papaver somniferum]|uniref:uncharacterized protein LOC113323369 isoform X3 n=1 Tax=Papaver somniferum TaxID=3469 RepID=UPI000E6FBFB3|nr:uncharacterized protein LOC113323369 isoform X3 [Papaver somniferum]
MGAMAGQCLPSLGRVKLTDLIASEGLPSDTYKISVSTLAQSLTQFSAVIIQLSASDGALLRSGLESAHLYFHQKASYPNAHMVHNHDSRDWCRTSGYYAEPQLCQETYDFRPGLTPTEPNNNTMEYPPAGLPDMFPLLARVARDVLDAITFSLNLRSSAFNGILDNVPLRNREISSSVLSVCCHSSRQAFQGQQHGLTTQDDDLGPHEAIVYPGLALYYATAGYVTPATHRIDTGSLHGYGRCSLAFKLMPKSMASLSGSEMSAAGHGIEAQFQLPILVDDFMQRTHPVDQLHNRQSFQNYNFPAAQDGSLKSLVKRRKPNTRCKPLPPSKRLRLEAQRVLKERVQEIADKKGIKLRFCSLKDCESHIQSLDSPCGSIRMEIGWPPGVPFVHPHDLPNKAKLGFLEAYEPGWTASQDVESSLIETGQASQYPSNCKSLFAFKSFEVNWI